MLKLEKYDEWTPNYEKRQLTNFVTLVNMEWSERKIDSGLADLIDQAADEGMRGNKLNKLISKIDEIKSLMNDIKQVMEMDNK